MKVTSQELAQLQKIERLFGEIDSIYSGLSAELQEKIQDIHSHEGSLGYCTRWGAKAAEEIVEECAKESISLLDEFKEYCFQKGEEAGAEYKKQYLDKFMVVDQTYDSCRDDSNMYSYAADFLIDEYPEWFEGCESIEECDCVLKEKHGDTPFNDYLEDERSNLSYGAANLKGAVLVEFGSIGRWNGTHRGLNILEVKNIGELLTSDCEQWMCYVDAASGEFCKSAYHHDGSNHYEYRELTCDRAEFEEKLEQAGPGEMEELVSKYSKSIGPRVAEVYGWDLEKAAKIEQQLSDLFKEGFPLQQIEEIRQKVVLEKTTLDEAIEGVKNNHSLEKRMAGAKEKQVNHSEKEVGRVKDNIPGIEKF